ncbi:hypothetical protein CEXT_560911 [Caerostris extrusa]|uniref:Uncharacterized protein n=1 Tax=Caerostris extrusa TaxID=172846 RepID=A0AAV4XFJ3_CAEEX|nr:hypothetical protein CEXT_560911 [Caerostris extrusa]
MIGEFSFLVGLWVYVQVFWFENWAYSIHFIPFILIAKLLIERSNSGHQSVEKRTKDFDCQTCLVIGAKDASTSTDDLEYFAEEYGEEEACLLDEAMALQTRILFLL